MITPERAQAIKGEYCLLSTLEQCGIFSGLSEEEKKTLGFINELREEQVPELMFYLEQLEQLGQGGFPELSPLLRRVVSLKNI